MSELKEITLEIPKEDIKKYDYSDYWHCPITRALQRALRSRKVFHRYGNCFEIKGELITAVNYRYRELNQKIKYMQIHKIPYDNITYTIYLPI